MRKGQAAVEFALGLSILFFLFLTFLIAITSKTVARADEDVLQSAMFIEQEIRDEVQVASVALDGYYREFSIPRHISGLEYDIDTKVYPDDNLTIVTFVVPNYNDYEYSFVLNQNITITSIFNIGDNTISKDRNFIEVNA